LAVEFKFGQNQIKITFTLREDLSAFMSLIFVMQTDRVLFEVPAEAKEIVDDLKLTTECVFCVRFELKLKKHLI
jgi:hypothetical protein